MMWKQVGGFRKVCCDRERPVSIATSNQVSTLVGRVDMMWKQVGGFRKVCCDRERPVSIVTSNQVSTLVGRVDMMWKQVGGFRKVCCDRERRRQVVLSLSVFGTIPNEGGRPAISANWAEDTQAQLGAMMATVPHCHRQPNRH